jgi:16S rRNA (guanine966-N2)-methyltransferase
MASTPPGTRITAGEWRGRVVPTPRGRPVRPTSALVRRALFDIIGPVEGVRMIDLYAGAGTVGFEALSRGADEVVFVEREHSLVELIRASAARLGCSDRCRIVGAEVVAWLARHPTEVLATDLVYLDAPYRDDSVVAALDLLGQAPPRLVVCEHHRARRFPERLGRLQRVRESTYGATQLSFWRRDLERDLEEVR